MLSSIGSRWRVRWWQIQASPIATAILLHDWRGLFGAGIASPSDRVWVVRRDWPNSGGHELVCPRRQRGAAFRALAADAAHWWRGPVRPEVSLVQVTLVYWRAHPGRCWARVCPMVAWSLPLAAHR